MSTHNICFHGEIRKIFTGYPLLSRPMYMELGIWLYWGLFVAEKGKKGTEELLEETKESNRGR